MRVARRCLSVLGLGLLLAGIASQVRADITWAGDVDPDDPSTWNSGTLCYIGKSGDGTITVDGGSDLQLAFSYLGYEVGSAGTVTVDGVGSTWTNLGGFYVGHLGNGTLNISGGGTVNIDDSTIGGAPGATGLVVVDGSGSTWICDGDLTIGNEGHGALSITGGGAVDVTGNTSGATWPDSSGEIYFDEGTLTTDGLVFGIDNLMGTGVINTHGLASDVDLVFDGTHGLDRTFTLSAIPGQDITVHLDVDGSGSMGAGYSGTATMSISDGITVPSRYGYVGYRAGASGTATVDGPGSSWDNSLDLFVGHSGNGSLDITDGGAVSCLRGAIGVMPGSAGQVAVDGSGSTWTITSLTLYGRGSGTLVISNGGAVVSHIGTIGYSTGQPCQVTVDGVGSTWSSDQLIVGSSGSGTLEITDGGAVAISGVTQVAKRSGSSGTIHFENGSLSTDELLCAAADLTGTGTVHTHALVSDVDLVFDATHGLNQTITLNELPDQNITIHLEYGTYKTMGAGYGGSGTMTIADGITVTAQNGYIGYNVGSSGCVTVDGLDSLWYVDRDLDVGYRGTGTLAITGGGAVGGGSYRPKSSVGSQPGSSGHVIVNGAGSLWSNNDIKIGEEGSGTLWITGGGTVSSEDSMLGYNLDSTGLVIIDGSGSAWIIDEELTVSGHGSGAISITDGGLLTVAATLSINRFSDYGDGFINMATGGMLALNGDVDGSIAEFLGIVKGTDAIRYWDYSTLDWSDIASATFGEDYTLEYLTEGDLVGYTVLTVGEPGLPGDWDGDSDVDLADLMIVQRSGTDYDIEVWREQFGAGSPGDFDLDADVDVADLMAIQHSGTAQDLADWRAHFGFGAEAGGVSSVASIPEPTAAFLSALAVLWGVARRRRA